ncbi:hypothetical protein DESC_720004 [Desulfosarcina cetonica]|nr:hypothetical protein DESC_720004 [Desulfosarcina cetonica]
MFLQVTVQILFDIAAHPVHQPGGGEVAAGGERLGQRDATVMGRLGVENIVHERNQGTGIFGPATAFAKAHNRLGMGEGRPQLDIGQRPQVGQIHPGLPKAFEYIGIAVAVVVDDFHFKALLEIVGHGFELTEHRLAILHGQRNETDRFGVSGFEARHENDHQNEKNTPHTLGHPLANG